MILLQYDVRALHGSGVCMLDDVGRNATLERYGYALDGIAVKVLRGNPQYFGRLASTQLQECFSGGVEETR